VVSKKKHEPDEQMLTELRAKLLEKEEDNAILKTRIETKEELDSERKNKIEDQ